MLTSRRTAALIVGIMTVTALLLVIDRGGVLAWATLCAGIALLAKIRFRPSGIDPGLGLVLAAVSASAWVGTYYYVISTWESGEVVELAVDTDDGVRTARVWVLDVGDDPLVYYDAEPEVAQSLLDGRPLQLNRRGEVSIRIPRATPADELSDDDANRIFETMVGKYGDRVGAADVYYLMLGRPRDRIAVVAELRAPFLGISPRIHLFRFTGLSFPPEKRTQCPTTAQS